MRRSAPYRLVMARTEGPAKEPLTLDEAKSHLRVCQDDDDVYIDGLIGAARAHVEEVTGRALITQTWTRRLDSFPTDGVILLPRPPLQSVTSITYIDGDGAEQTLATDQYDVHVDELPGRVTRRHDVVWPTTRTQPNAVTVEYVAGYGPTRHAVPPAIRHAMKLLLGHMYEHREPEVTGHIISRFHMATDSLLAPYRAWWF